MKKYNSIIDGSEKMASKINFEKKIKTFIKNLDERIKLLAAKGSEISDEGKEKYDNLLGKLVEQRRELAIKKKSISELSEDKWEEIKESVNHDFACMKDQVEVTYESIRFLNKLMRRKFKWLWRTDKTKDDERTNDVI